MKDLNKVIKQRMMRHVPAYVLLSEHHVKKLRVGVCKMLKHFSLSKFCSGELLSTGSKVSGMN